MPKRILYIVPSWFTLNYHLRGQLSFLKSKGFEVEVACEADPRAKKAAIREGVEYHRININTTSFSPLQDLKSLYHLVQLIKKRKYMIVNCCTKKGSFLGAMASKLTGVTGIVYVVHGLTVQKSNNFENKIFFLLEKIVCKLSHRVIFISRSNMELFKKNKLCSKNKAVLLGEGSVNGVDTDHFRKADENAKEAEGFRKAYGIPKEAYVFGFVGRLVREKGIRELEKAWRMLRNKYDKLLLLMVAPPETDSAYIVRILQKDPKVHFTGFMEDPTVAYAAMDCLVFPSYGEGFGQVVLEASSMELPVIASRVMGCVDSVVHEQTGLLVEPRNAQALAMGIERVLMNQEESRRWGQNGRRRCIELFKPELIWQGLTDLYNELIVANKIKKS